MSASESRMFCVLSCDTAARRAWSQLTSKVRTASSFVWLLPMLIEVERVRVLEIRDRFALPLEVNRQPERKLRIGMHALM